MPKVSIVLPVYNGAAHLREALDSIYAQTMEDWELLVVNEYGSNDGSSGIVYNYAAQDPRFKLIQNTERLGLAESLNRGISESAGYYIARIDADDQSLPDRFRKQTDFLDAHNDVGILGTWQQHYGDDGLWVHKPPSEPERLAANLLFCCDICHSTVMMRKSVLAEHGLFYDKRYYAEDYELWTRAMCVTKLANLPEVLGKYRHGSNISTDKMASLEAEHGTLCAAAIKRTLSLVIQEKDQYLLNAWTNIFQHERDKRLKKQMLDDYSVLLRRIWAANKSAGFFDEACLLNTLRARWIWALTNLIDDTETAGNLEDVFRPVDKQLIRRIRQALERNPKPSMILKKVIRY
jgi:glycosyltransferase involved in cell wall biosynthesis